MGDNSSFVSHDIFISYRREDKQLASLTFFFLESMGYDVWWDAKLNTENTYDHDSDDYPKVIDSIIEHCSDFILIVTEKTFDGDRINNKEDWVHREIKHALEQGKRIRIHPLLVEGAQPPKSLPPEIERLKYTHFRSFPIDPFMNTTEQSRKVFTDILKATPSFKPIYIKDNYCGSYDPNMEEEGKRIVIQANNGRHIDMQIIDRIIYDHPEGGLTVLDVGCGNGYVGQDRFADPHFTKVIGIDSNKRCIKTAIDNLKNKEEKEAEKFIYFEADIEMDDFADQMRQCMHMCGTKGFDIVFLSEVLHFHRQKDALDWIISLKSLMNEAGCIIIKEADDGTKMAYGSNGDYYLAKILDMTNALRQVADRRMGRQLSGLLKDADFDQVEIYSYMRETSNMAHKERMDLFREGFDWRLNAVSRENEPDSQTVREMKENLKKLKTCFERNTTGFWYCTYDYFGIGKINSKKKEQD